MSYPGYVFVECDLSQAELRIAAWMANDPAMLKVYREGRDIHEATAAGVMGLTIEQFPALPDDGRKKKRQDAKATIEATDFPASGQDTNAPRKRILRQRRPVPEGRPAPTCGRSGTAIG